MFKINKSSLWLKSQEWEGKFFKILFIWEASLSQFKLFSRSLIFMFFGEWFLLDMPKFFLKKVNSLRRMIVSDKIFVVSCEHYTISERQSVLLRVKTEPWQMGVEAGEFKVPLHLSETLMQHLLSRPGAGQKPLSDKKTGKD